VNFIKNDHNPMVLPPRDALEREDLEKLGRDLGHRPVIAIRAPGQEYASRFAAARKTAGGWGRLLR